MTEHKIAYDPSVGRGYWDYVNRLSLDIKTLADRLFVIETIKKIQKVYPCAKCRSHLDEYMKNNPLDKLQPSWKDGKDYSIAKWWWILHNTVNTRNNKPTVPWQNFIVAYTSISVCTADCDEESPPPKVEPVKVTEEKTEVFIARRS